MHCEDTRVVGMSRTCLVRTLALLGALVASGDRTARAVEFVTRENAVLLEAEQFEEQGGWGRSARYLRTPPAGAPGTHAPRRRQTTG